MARQRRDKGEDRVVELLLALRDSQTVSLRVPSGHHVEVGARRPPLTGVLICLRLTDYLAMARKKSR